MLVLLHIRNLYFLTITYIKIIHSIPPPCTYSNKTHPVSARNITKPFTSDVYYSTGRPQPRLITNLRACQNKTRQDSCVHSQMWATGRAQGDPKEARRDRHGSRWDRSGEGATTTRLPTQLPIDPPERATCSRIM
ncbi:hypothetical protein GWI33_008023 [Rhynchophorus ferrugineus]|uniref:Uncharacterized protein n=1 Tax=Rhynchophorus ferrugineus TaxID=354439 RepID=A0A834IVU7_RHYFE|nr:hypothetical protein GWI33_008023 [Rhynchophorus ferrugineus]